MSEVLKEGGSEVTLYLLRRASSMNKSETVTSPPGKRPACHFSQAYAAVNTLGRMATCAANLARIVQEGGLEALAQDLKYHHEEVGATMQVGCAALRRR